MMKTKNKILIGIGILAIVVFVIAYWQLLYCPNTFHTLANEELIKDKYKYCNSDSDCKVIGCGSCVNSEGASRYNNLKSFCLGETMWKCIIPETCFCVNNTCAESQIPSQELTDDEKKAVWFATAHLSFPITILEVKKLECEGCFSVKFQRDDNQLQFTKILDNWKIKKYENSAN